jgi:hypothetical protein
MRHLDLFSGIGGFALAASSVWGDDYKNVGFCDIEPFSQAILKKHWPNAKIYSDIKKLSGGVLAQLTLSPEVFPASHSVQLGSDEARKMTAISGQKCFELYEKQLPAGSLVKTLAASLLGTEAWSSMKCSLTWKPRATKSGRLLFQLSPSTLRTVEIESGLLHTPAAQEPGVRVERLITKKGEPAKVGQRAYDKKTGRLAQVGLSQQIGMSLLPTPRVSEAEGSPVKNTEFNNGSFSRVNRKGVRFGVKVKDVLAMLPTPQSRDYKGAGAKGRDSVDSLIEKGVVKSEVGQKTGLKLQPSFALWMMGYPTDHLDLKDGEMPPSKGRATRSSRKSLLS